MLRKDLEQQLNEQMNKEFESFYLYYAMSSYCDLEGLKGCAKWLMIQANEEKEHAEKIYGYLRDQGNRPRFKALSEPKVNFTSLEDLFKAALEAEEERRDSYEALATVALAKKDNTTYVFLQWFLTEQVEEIALCNDILAKLRLVGKSGPAIYAFDAEMGRR